MKIDYSIIYADWDEDFHCISGGIRQGRNSQKVEVFYNQSSK